MFRPTRLSKNLRPLSLLFARNTNALDTHANVWINNSMQLSPFAVDHWQSFLPFHHINQKPRYFHQTCFCLNNDNPENKTQEEVKPKKAAGQLAKVFAEYGSTAVVFHTAISLTSLGICYLAVSRYVCRANNLRRLLYNIYFFSTTIFIFALYLITQSLNIGLFKLFKLDLHS